MANFTVEELLDKACKAETDYLSLPPGDKSKLRKQAANVAFRAAMRRESDPSYMEDIIP